MMKARPDKRARCERRPTSTLVLSLVALFASTAGIALALQANSIRSKHIVNEQVRTADLAEGAVRGKKLAPKSVKSPKIADLAVGENELRDGAVGSRAVANNSLFVVDIAGGLGAQQLGPGSVTAGKLGPNSINGAKVQSGALAGLHLATGSITGPHLAANSVNSARVIDNSLLASDVVVSDLGSPLARGLTRVDAQTASNSDNFKEVEAECPGSKKLIGGGGDVTVGAGTTAALVASFPSLDGTRWLARASEPSPSDTSWSLGAYAICAST
jgi:hypothetical protein